MCDLFNAEEYGGNEHQGTFDFGSSDFSLRQVFNHYLGKQKRYPTSAFVDMYIHDAVQEYARSQDEYTEINRKAKKVAQLA